MRLTITVSGATGPGGGQERELGRWLGDVDQLRGRVHLVERRVQTGALIDTVVTVVVELGPPALAALGGALVTWLRHRTSDTRVVVRRTDGTRFELSARRVRGLTTAEVSALVDQIAGTVDAGPAGGRSLPGPAAAPGGQPTG